MARSTNAIDSFNGALQFETEWLYFGEHDQLSDGQLRRFSPTGRCACCSVEINRHFDIPAGTRRMTLVFSTDPDEGMWCQEHSFKYFVEAARSHACIPEDFNRSWYWWPCFDSEPAKAQVREPIALDEYTGTLKFETAKLFFANRQEEIDEDRYWLHNDDGDSVCCTPVILSNYNVPLDTQWLTLIFSTNPDEGVEVREWSLDSFVNRARRAAQITADMDRRWYWSVGLPA